MKMKIFLVTKLAYQLNNPINRAKKSPQSLCKLSADCSPVKANGNFKFLIFFSSKLSIRIAIDVSFIHADVNVVVCIIVVGVVLMNNVEIIL